MTRHEIEDQTRVIRRIKKELIPLKHKETEAKRLWVMGYRQFLNADEPQYSPFTQLTTDTGINWI